MELLWLGAVLLCLGVAGTASPLEAPSAGVPPREAARIAVEAYNQATGTQAVFRLLKIRNIHKTRFDWGFHFSLNFTVRETSCQKTDSYRIENCKYKLGGSTRDCSAEVSVLNFMDDTPLTSVTCNSLQVEPPLSGNWKGPGFCIVPDFGVFRMPNSWKRSATFTSVRGFSDFGAVWISSFRIREIQPV